MATIRELRSRIRSIQSTKRSPRRRELIATSRITKAQAGWPPPGHYAQEITKVVTTLAGASVSLDSPLLTAGEPRRAAVLVVTSDSGQCGGYNSNVLRETEELLALLRSEGKDPVLT